MADKRTFVMDHMSYRGSKSHLITPYEWSVVYLLGDGFGRVDEAWAHEQAWDWSHVRDSSPEAIEAMAAKIEEFLNTVIGDRIYAIKEKTK